MSLRNKSLKQGFYSAVDFFFDFNLKLSIPIEDNIQRKTVFVMPWFLFRVFSSWKNLL